MTDTIKAAATYAIATIIIVGGGIMLFAIRHEPGSGDLIAVIAGFMGAAIQFVFNRETQTQTARQVERSQGTAPPEVTVTSTAGSPEGDPL